MKDRIFEGVSFSHSFVEGFKTESDFLKEMNSTTYQHVLQGEDREAKLKELYSFSHPVPHPKEKAVKKGGKP